MIFTILLVLLSSLLLCIYWFQYFSNYSKQINQFPGPPYRAIFGNILDVESNTVSVFNKLRKWNSSFQESFRLWGPHMATVHIVTPEDMEIILTSTTCIKKGMVYDFITPWLGTGSLTGGGSKWQHRRKLLTPAFHFSILRRFVTIFGEQSQILVEELQNECKQPKTNILPIISKHTLKIINETAMGSSVTSNAEEQESYFEAIHAINCIAIKRVISPWLFFDMTLKLFPTGWQLDKIVKKLHSFTASEIYDREKRFKIEDVQDFYNDGNVDNNEETGDENEDGDVYGGKKKLAMLDLLFASKHKQLIDDEGIREEVETFMFAGHDTVGMVLTFSIMLIANNPDIQERIVEEQRKIFGKSQKPAILADLHKMKYLEMCIKEVLRLYPGVPYISRNNMDGDLHLSKHIVPAGTEIGIFIYDLHRNPNIYPDPEKFDPDRFLPENVKKRHVFAYLPFSAGQRNCIGQKFAMFELKCTLSSILRNFIVDAVDTPQTITLQTDFVIRPVGGVHVKFKPRDF